MVLLWGTKKGQSIAGTSTHVVDVGEVYFFLFFGFLFLLLVISFPL
jgi:hypothetical protein